MARRLQPADTLLGPAVQATIHALQTSPEDAGAVKLARQYADAIDTADERGEALDRLGPKLLAVLESLGATPRARAAIRKGDTGAPGQGKLAALRAARRPA